MNLIHGLSVPVSLDFFFDLIAEIGFCFYFLVRVKLVEKLFIQLSFFQQAYFGNRNVEKAIARCRICFIQTEVPGNPLSFLLIKRIFQLRIFSVTCFPAHPVFTETFCKIFNQNGIVFFNTAFHFISTGICFSKKNVQYIFFRLNSFFILHIPIPVLQAVDLVVNHFIGHRYHIAGGFHSTQVRQIKSGFHPHFKMKSIIDRIIYIQLA